MRGDRLGDTDPTILVGVLMNGLRFPIPSENGSDGARSLFPFGLLPPASVGVRALAVSGFVKAFESRTVVDIIVGNVGRLGRVRAGDGMTGLLVNIVG